MDCEKIIKKTLVFLLAGGKGQRLYPLTEERVKPAVPFGGKYRIIDFTLSNCVNSGLRKILVVTQYKSASLSRHLALGWGFLSDRFSEYITDIPPQQRLGERWYVGTADAVYQNLYFVEREESEYVLILSGDHIYKMDYREMLEFHIEHKAEITIGAVLVKKERSKSFGIMQVDSNGKVVDFREKPKNPFTLPDLPDYSLASMGIYIFNRETLNKLLAHDAKIQNSSHDFGKDIIPFAISNKNKVFSYRFVDKNNKQGYWQDVGTIDSFYNANMDLLSSLPKLNLYDKSWPFFTHARQFPPAKFTFKEIDGEKIFGYAKDSLIADGVIVEGGTILHSVIFPKVRIGVKSSIEDSVIFNNTNIGGNTRIKKTIIDKRVFVPDNVEIGFNREADEKYFYVSNSGIVVIPRGYRFPESFPRIPI
ncbi:MAG: glucose-1-phosphate adenylyltransferase [Caldisericaceae bacterium]|nr:glucose-1-phosphate adenylyltransferase [Caldisericaceae bacterium]